MKKYEKPTGKVTNLRAMLDEAIAMREKAKKLQPALASGDGPTLQAATGIDFSRFTKINLS